MTFETAARDMTKKLNVLNDDDRFIDGQGIIWGAKGFSRIVGNPAIITAVVVSTAGAVAMALSLPEVDRTANLIQKLTTNLGLFGIFAGLDFISPSTKLDSRYLKSVVIDKSGKAIDPAENCKLISHYKIDALTAPVAFALVAGLVYMVGHQIPWLALTWNGSKALWCAHAWRKLNKQVWTASKTPPPKPVRQTKAADVPLFGIQPAAQPV